MTESLLVIQGLLAYADRLRDLLGQDWPTFRDRLIELLDRLAQAEDDTQAIIAIDDVIAAGLDSPAAELIRALLAQASVGADQIDSTTRSIPMSDPTSGQIRRVEITHPGADKALSVNRADLVLAGQSLAEELGGARLYTVWYGTNREPVDSNDPNKGFSALPSKANHVSYGACTVCIPKSRKFGSVGSSWWKRWLTFTDNRLYVQKRQSKSETEFWDSVRSALAEWGAGKRQALVYLHGYKTEFDEAAIRAAQIGYDLRVPETAFFSWPSQGSLEGYLADGASIEASEGVITDFLAHFAAKSGAERVHVIAHSMGNRGLLRALQRIEAMAERRSQVKFGQVFLAAPDIDAGLFSDLAHLYPLLSERTTLYVSPRDKALGGSTWLHCAPRAGFTPPVTVVPGVDTVEVADLDLTFWGHSYYAEAEALLHDMFDLLSRNAAPKDRQRLLPKMTRKGLAYWAIQP